MKTLHRMSSCFSLTDTASTGKHTEKEEYVWSESHFTCTLVPPYPRMLVAHCSEDNKEGDHQG